MKTKKLYEEDVYKNTCFSRVLSAEADGGKLYLTFDQTIFFPTGGGQSCDTGTISLADGSNTLNIIDVEEFDAKSDAKSTTSPDGEADAGSACESGKAATGDIIHTADATGVDISRFAPGTEVLMEINWSRRFDNMQRHCGEHILSGAMYRLFGAVNRGFHMSDDFMVIDFELPRSGWNREKLCSIDPDDPNTLPDGEYQAPGRVNWAMAEEAELEANRVIWRNSPVTTQHFETRDEAERMPLRKHLAFDEDISIVTIGSLPRPDDCCPCCGTHPSAAGQVGMIKIYKIEPNKGMTRMYMEAGERAFRHAQRHFDDFYDIAVGMSAGTEDALLKFRKFQAKDDEMHDEIRILKQSLTVAEASALASAMEPCKAVEYRGMTSDDLFNIAKKLTGAIHDYVFLIDADHALAVACANTDAGYNAGKLIKEEARAYGGKGGGKPASAMVKFESMDALNAFISHVKASL